MNPLLQNLPIHRLRETAFVLLWAAAAVLSRESAPWFFWASLVALPAFVIINSERDYLKSTAGRKVLLLCLLVLTFHIAWALIRAGFYDASQPTTYWKDDHAYYVEATAIAKAWRAGNYPEIWLKGSPPYLGTLHVGYHRPLSGLFFLFGPSTVLGLLLNAFCAACFPLFAALISRNLWSGNNEVPTGTMTDFGYLAAILVAAHPMQFYWASFLMKDTYLAFVFLATLALVLGTYRRRRLALGIGAIFVLPHLFTVRAYTAMSLVAGAVILPFMGVRRILIGRAVLITGSLLVLFCAYTNRGGDLYRQLRDSFVALAPPGLENPIQLLLQMGAGVPRLFLGPYAWIILEKPNPMYGMYPGMWYLYLVGYPFGFAGLYVAVRRNIKAAVVPLVVFGLSALIFLSAAYQGNASRQRFYLEYIVLIFAAYGIRNPSRWWIAGILTIELIFAVGQLISLR